MDKAIWSILNVKSPVEISTRDDQAIGQLDDGSFLIFGGFVKGARVNEVIHFKYENLALHGVIIDGENSPSTRASMSGGYHNGKFWVFGGQDEENHKLNDLWNFDVSSRTWSQTKFATDDFVP